MMRKILLPLVGAILLVPAALAQTVHVDDNFDFSNAPNEPDSVWVPHRGSHPENWAVYETDPDGTTANKSIWVNGGSFERTLTDTFGPLSVSPSHEEPMVFSFRFYDYGTLTGEGREGNPLVYGELQATTSTPLFAAGIAAQSWFNESLGSKPATFDATRYQARMYPTASGSAVSNWFQLNTVRSVGWHTFTFIIRPDTFDILVDGKIDQENLLWRSTGAIPIFSKIRMGGGFSTVGAPALFDDVYLATDAKYKRDLIIRSHPERAFRHYNELVTFTVDATATGDISYQWYKGTTALSDGGEISGSQTAELTIANLTPADNGDYKVVVSTVAGTLTSSSANLYVTEPHEFIVNGGPSSDKVILSGSEWSLNATGGFFGYRWGSMTSDPALERTVTFPVEITETGYYNVYTWFAPSAAGGNRPTEAPYHIYHADGDQWVFMNQQLPNGNKWELLVEAVRMEAGGDNKVVISNLIQEGRTGGGALMVDAVRWVKVDAPVVTAPPTVTISRRSGADVGLEILGSPSTAYIIEVSVDLVSWTALATPVTTNSQGAADFVDSDTINTRTHRFYRIAAQP